MRNLDELIADVRRSESRTIVVAVRQASEDGAHALRGERASAPF